MHSWYQRIFCEKLSVYFLECLVSFFKKSRTTTDYEFTKLDPVGKYSVQSQELRY